MKREDLKQVPTEDLQKKYKTFKIAFYVLAGLVAVILVASYFNWTKSGFNATVLMPVFFIPMVLINYLNVRKIGKELESRSNVE